MRAVLDTNVLISSVISTDVPHEIVLKGCSSYYQIVMPVNLDEAVALVDGDDDWVADSPLAENVLADIVGETGSADRVTRRESHRRRRGRARTRV